MPQSRIQLLNYDLNIETQLRNLIIDYSKNYDYWVKNSIKFSESKFGVNQYREYVIYLLIMKIILEIKNVLLNFFRLEITKW